MDNRLVSYPSGHASYGYMFVPLRTSRQRCHVNHGVRHLVAQDSPRGDGSGPMCLDQCLEAGRILKCILKQSQAGNIPKVREMNEEMALDFAGPFQSAIQGQNTCWCQLIISHIGQTLHFYIA